jgi:hypothetical protein
MLLEREIGDRTQQRFDERNLTAAGTFTRSAMRET